MASLQLFPLLTIALGTVFFEHAYADIALDYALTLVGKKITVDGLDHAAVKSADTHGEGYIEFQVWGDTEKYAYMHTVLITVSTEGQSVAETKITGKIRCLRSRNGQNIQDTASSEKLKGLCDKVLKGLQDAKTTTKLDAAEVYPVYEDDKTIKKLHLAIRPTATAAQPTFKQLTIGGVNWKVVGAATPMNKVLTGGVRLLLFIAKAKVSDKPASMQIGVTATGTGGYTVNAAIAQYALDGVSAKFSDVVTDTTITTAEIMNTKIQEALKAAAK